MNHLHGERNKKVEKIDNQQLNYLIELLENKMVKSKIILSICNIQYLTDLTVIQYNYLLLLLNKIF